jgi:polysaccharide deacetylase family protein (PEP-CTERM system associated)
MVLNALSIDVEEYFQVTGFEDTVRRADWGGYESRLSIGLGRLLEIFERHGVKATFFFLGWVAERHPDALRRVAALGHEIGVHGYDHRLVYHQTPQAFQRDVSNALERIRRVYSGEVLGYRAPSFSVREDTLWSLEILKELGFRYDSSVFPFRRRRYGIARAPQAPYEVLPGLFEFPMSTVSLFGHALPVAGGGYFRLYPSWLTRWAIRRINAEGRPAIVYVHPWELDPDQPRLRGSWGNVFRHRVNLSRTASRLDSLCREFAFAPIRDVLAIEAQKGDRPS